MEVLSVNVGKAGELFPGQADGARRGIVSGIHKQPVQCAVKVERLGLDGDEQADRRLHGGPDKAVYAYPSEHYPFWRARRLAAVKRDEPLPPGTMGENLTLRGLTEDAVWIGDRLRIAGVLLEVTEPRQPCFKLNARMGFGHAVKMMLQSGHTGFYLRVLEAGMVEAGDRIVLIPGPRALTVAQLSRRRNSRQHELF